MVAGGVTGVFTGTPPTGFGFVVTGLLTGVLVLGVVTGLVIGTGGLEFGLVTGVVEGAAGGIDPRFGVTGLGVVDGTVTTVGAELSGGILVGVVTGFTIGVVGNPDAGGSIQSCLIAWMGNNSSSRFAKIWNFCSFSLSSSLCSNLLDGDNPEMQARRINKKNKKMNFEAPLVILMLDIFLNVV